MSSDEESQQAVQAFIRSRHDRFLVNCEVSGTLEFAPSTVWAVLLETQHLGFWLTDRERNDRPVSKGRAAGSCINEEWLTYLVEVDQRGGREQRLSFSRPFYNDHPPFYFTITLKPYERYFSTISITARGPQTRALSLLERLFSRFDKTYVETATYEITDALALAPKRLRDLCWARTKWGPMPDSPGSPLNWVSWLYTGNELRYYENRQGQIGPQVGELIERGERIGYVRVSGDPRSDDYFKEHCYLEPGSGYVIDVYKRHGEQVGKGDRLLLLAEAPHPDMSVVGVAGEHIFDSYLSIASVDVTRGQSVTAGQVVAVVTDKHKYGRAADYLVRSKYDGEVVDVLAKAGDAFSNSVPVIKLRVPRLVAS